MNGVYLVASAAVFTPIAMFIVSTLFFYACRKVEHKSFSMLIGHIGYTFIFALSGFLISYVFGLLLFCITADSGARCVLYALYFASILGVPVGVVAWLYIWMGKRARSGRSMKMQ